MSSALTALAQDFADHALRDFRKSIMAFSNADLSPDITQTRLPKTCERTFTLAPMLPED